MVKLQKLSCPFFSGITRYLECLRREFNLIVISGYIAIEIGMNLMNALPEKYKYYIGMCVDTTNHEEMMTISENKIGAKTLVVNDIINKIKKFKNFTSDKSFVD